MVVGEKMDTTGRGRDALTRFWLGLLAACMVLAGVGIYSVLATLSARADAAVLEPQIAAQEFYAWYLAQAGSDPDGQVYHESAALAPSLVRAVDALLAGEEQIADPFLCTQDFPARIVLSPVHVGLDTAVYHLTGEYPSAPGGLTERSLADVTLHASDGQWRITGIRCTH